MLGSGDERFTIQDIVDDTCLFEGLTLNVFEVSYLCQSNFIPNAKQPFDVVALSGNRASPNAHKIPGLQQV